MSHTFALKGTSHLISADIYPPIELDPRCDYGLGLIGFHTYYTIPNVVEGANKFHYGDDKVITLPVGSYEITDIEEYLKKALPGGSISITANNNTLKCGIKSKYQINFKEKDTIGRMLGFSERILEANKRHESDLPVKIIKVVTIRIECNITSSAYHNARLSHTIYEFAPQVEPGYAINIEPQHVIYLPVNTKRIDNITVTLLDQDNEALNFRGEQIVVRLELKKLQ